MDGKGSETKMGSPNAFLYWLFLYAFHTASKNVGYRYYGNFYISRWGYYQSSVKQSNHLAVNLLWRPEEKERTLSLDRDPLSAAHFC